MSEPSILLQCGQAGWRTFSGPVRTIRATTTAEVLPALSKIESAVAQGQYAVGFLSYEAAPAFDDALVTHPPSSLPLLWFRIYERSELIELPEPAEPEEPEREEALREWQPTLDLAGYRAAVQQIRDRIASGDTYQVNFTWRLDTCFESDPWPFFIELASRDRTRYAAFIDTGDHAVCSFSPELFFRLDGSRIVCRPMKGTARRGLYRADDLERSLALASSPKDQAENVMIVDMLRNDLGRVAVSGTVETTRLFDIETYPTVHQMTSTIEAETKSSFTEILTALFPCASITGAPKVETMKIITDLEDRARGVYTGAIGYLGPGRQALFNVAIRTVHVDRVNQTAEYGTGGGIVWDSEPDAEYVEGRTKTLILAPEPLEFRLLETMRWSPGDGYYLLHRHLDRLVDSADFLDFVCDRKVVVAELEAFAETLPSREHRIRLLLSRVGSVHLESHRLVQAADAWNIGLARRPIDATNQFLYHKTTARQVYEELRLDVPNVDDVLLWNLAGELTETTLANVALEMDGAWYTPPVASGLLAGTLRAELLEQGRISEKVLTLDDLDRASSIALLNSVRGWIPARMSPTVPAAPEPKPG